MNCDAASVRLEAKLTDAKLLDEDAPLSRQLCILRRAACRGPLARDALVLGRQLAVDAHQTLPSGGVEQLVVLAGFRGDPLEEIDDVAADGLDEALKGKSISKAKVREQTRAHGQHARRLEHWASLPRASA